tara:strand:- start:469 stop:771 length:303 start_codon:yes stop_codon:yes gene_type:complete
MSNEAIANLIDNISSKNFSKAGTAFNNAIKGKLQDTLDQTKTRLAGSMFGSRVAAVEPEDDLVAGEVTQDDLDFESAADEVENDIDNGVEVDDDDDGDDD